MSTEQLFAALREKDLPAIRKLVDAGCDIANIEPGGYDTPLQMATSRGHIEAVKLLLARGAPVNGRSKTGRTALFDGVIEFDREVFRLLIAAGADVNAADDGGETPIWMARTWEQFKLLLDHGAHVQPNTDGKTLLWRMVEIAGRHPDEAIPILDKLVELGLRVDGEPPDGRGFSILMQATRDSSGRVVHWLLDHGADVAHVSRDGITALHCACHDDNIAAVKELLERGADPNAKATAEFGPFKVGSRPIDSIAKLSRKRKEIIAALAAAGQTGSGPAMALDIDGDEISIDSSDLGKALGTMVAITKDVERNVFRHPDYDSADHRIAWKFSTGIDEHELFAKCAANTKLRPQVVMYVQQIVAANRARGGDPIYVHDELEAGGNAIEALVAAGKQEDVKLLKSYIESIDVDHTVQLHDVMSVARKAFSAKQLSAIDKIFDELGFEDVSRKAPAKKPARNAKKAMPRGKR